MVGHVRRECVDFVEALGNNILCLWDGRVHACETWKPLELNIGWGGMKWLMEEAATRHDEAVHYSASVGIQVGSSGDQKPKDSGFWP